MKLNNPVLKSNYEAYLNKMEPASPMTPLKSTSNIGEDNLRLKFEQPRESSILSALRAYKERSEKLSAEEPKPSDQSKRYSQPFSYSTRTQATSKLGTQGTNGAIYFI